MTQKLTTVFDEEQRLRSEDSDLMVETLSPDLEPLHKTNESSTCETSTPKLAATLYPYRFIPLTMDSSGRTHIVSRALKQLLEEEVSPEELEQLTSLFYENAFLDKTLDKFIRAHGDPHASRFAKWIMTKLTGSTVWNEDRRTRSKEPVALADGVQYVVHDRSSAHVAAWYSPKRPENEVGRHFQLDECRVWMRLHFWALRESGLMDKSPSFADYYVRFIAHFIRVYESSAPAFARDSMRWSDNPKNIEAYIASDRVMLDVLGLSLQDARSLIPTSEACDTVWPYSKTQAE